MSSVLAKFRLSAVEDAKYAPDGSATLSLMAVQGEPFGSATPSGYITMTIHNAAAALIFKNAYQVYLDGIKKRNEEYAATKDNTLPYPTQPEFFVEFRLDEHPEG